MLPVAVEPLLLEELPPLEELPLPEEPLLPEESPPPVELLLPAPAELLPLPEEAIPPLPAPAEAPLFPEAAPGVPELCAPVPAVGFASVAPPTGAAVDGVLTPPAPLVFDPVAASSERDHHHETGCERRQPRWERSAAYHGDLRPLP